jgi:hypothetical protein
LIKSFLKDDRFLLTSINAYNSLGVGTTQLYNQRTVYNHKRHGDFKLGNKNFSFRVKPHFPKKATPEFLLVDLVNNLDTLAEDQSELLKNISWKVHTMDPKNWNVLYKNMVMPKQNGSWHHLYLLNAIVIPIDSLHNHNDFQALSRILSDETGIASGLIEKDYWIMHVLYDLKNQGFEFELKGRHVAVERVSSYRPLFRRYQYSYQTTYQYGHKRKS